jgi:hypothetical protein
MLHDPKPGLRALFLDAKSAAKVELRVQPGDELHVSDDVADQLVAADPHFRAVGDVRSKGAPAPADDVDDEPVDDEPVDTPAPRRSRNPKG